jgi:hypothetical protein
VVLACGLEPLEKLRRRRARVRLEPPVAAEAHERVRLFRAARHDAARAVVLEGPPDQHLPVRQKRRGERVALEPAHPLAVEGELDGRGPLDQAAALGKTRAHRPALQPGRFASIASRISCGGAEVCAG